MSATREPPAGPGPTEEDPLSADLLRALADAAPVLLSFIDSAERYRFVNQTYEVWFGKPRSFFLGKTLREVIGDAAYASVAHHIARALRGERVQYRTAALPEQMGGRRFVDVIYVPRARPDGTIEGFFATIRDASLLVDAEHEKLEEAKKARAEAERQRARLYRLLEDAPAAIALLRGPEHVYELSNPVNTEMSGGRPLLGRRVRDALPELPPESLALLDRIYRTGEPFPFNEAPAPRLRRDGSVGEVRLTGVQLPTRDAEGRIDGIAIFAFDVTEQVLARERMTLLADASRAFAEAGGASLREALQRVVRLASDAFQDACVMTLVKEDGQTLEIAASHHPDPEAHAILQASMSGEYRGDGFPSQVFRSGQSVLLPKIEQTPFALQATPQSRTYLSRYPVLGVIVVPLRAGGRVLGTLGVSRTREHPVYTEADRELLQELADRAGLVIQNARLLKTEQEAVRLRDEFLSVASHELKTPLTSLKLQLDLIARALSPEAQAQAKPRIEAANRQFGRIGALVERLLDVSRITTGRLNLELSDVDLSAVVREVAAQFEGQAETAQSALELDLSDAVVGFWDRGRLEQVVTNLISNALKYGAGRPVRLAVRQREGMAELVVRDEGIGIAAEAIPRLFQRFERAVSDRHYGGLGLGLFITREIVRAMHGSVRVASTLGAGATVTVELPLRVPAEATSAGS